MNLKFDKETEDAIVECGREINSSLSELNEYMMQLEKDDIIEMTAQLFTKLAQYQNACIRTISTLGSDANMIQMKGFIESMQEFNNSINKIEERKTTEIRKQACESQNISKNK